jgi:hypothetical protein
MALSLVLAEVVNKSIFPFYVFMSFSLDAGEQVAPKPGLLS